MPGRFELLPMAGGHCVILFRDRDSAVLITSTPVEQFVRAARTIDWLRSAVHKDWLYRIGRQRRGAGPSFTLAAPHGVIFASATFSSSDVMEHAVNTLKAAAAEAPIVFSQELMTPPIPEPPGAVWPALTTPASERRDVLVWPN